MRKTKIDYDDQGRHVKRCRCKDHVGEPWLPIEENFTRSFTRYDGYQVWCKACLRAYQSKHPYRKKTEDQRRLRQLQAVLDRHGVGK